MNLKTPAHGRFPTGSIHTLPPNKLGIDKIQKKKPEALVPNLGPI